MAASADAHTLPEQRARATPASMDGSAISNPSENRAEFWLHVGKHVEPGEEIRNRAYFHVCDYIYPKTCGSKLCVYSVGFEMHFEGRGQRRAEQLRVPSGEKKIKFASEDCSSMSLACQRRVGTADFRPLFSSCGRRAALKKCSFAAAIEWSYGVSRVQG